jgi:hypothetical protein
MDFRARYLQAMREQAPTLFKRLSKDGQLEQHAALKSREAEQMFRDLTKDAPRDKHGRLSLQDEREAEEQVRAALLSFPEEETSPEQDERDYLLVGDRPLLPPERKLSNRAPAPSTKGAAPAPKRSTTSARSNSHGL